MIIKLVAKHNGKRTVIPLRATVAVIGRSHGNAVRIPSADVSRRHCRLLCKDGVVTVEDMESVNGTFLNGRRLKSPEVVEPGDQIEVGPVQFTIEYESATKVRPRPKLDENPTDLLEALADGDVMDAVEDLPELEIIERAPKRGRKPEPVDVEPVSSVDDLAPIEAEFDFESTPWQMPEGGDLRDLLEQMEEEPTRQAKAAKKRKAE